MLKKYRMLTVDELEPLEGEFISFLSANGIDASLWSKYKSTSNEIVENLIGEFSELVFEKICSKIDYLYFEANNIRASYHVKNDHTTMVAFERKNGKFNLEENIGIGGLSIQENPDFQIYKLDKAHKEAKNKEVFNLLELGCLKSDGTQYKQMILEWASIQENSN